MKSLDTGETPKRVVRITDDLWAWADNYSDLLGVSRSALIRDLLENERAAHCSSPTNNDN